MASPDAPLTVAEPPAIAEHKKPASVFTLDRGRHVHALEDRCAVAVDVGGACLHFVIMNDVVTERREPPFPRHDCSSRVHEHRRAIRTRAWSGEHAMLRGDVPGG